MVSKLTFLALTQWRLTQLELVSRTFHKFLVLSGNKLTVLTPDSNPVTFDSIIAKGEEIVINDPWNGGRLVTGASNPGSKLSSKFVPNGDDDLKQVMVNCTKVDDDNKVDKEPINDPNINEFYC